MLGIIPHKAVIATTSGCSQDFTISMSDSSSTFLHQPAAPCPVFPQELFEYIISLIWHSHRLHHPHLEPGDWASRKASLAALRACLLVSKSFYEPASKALFTHVTVTIRLGVPQSQSAKDLLRIIRGNDGIQERIRYVTLVLRGPDPEHQPRVAGSVIKVKVNSNQDFEDWKAGKLLNNLPRLHHLSITHEYEGVYYRLLPKTQFEGFERLGISAFNYALFTALQNLKSHPTLRTLEVGTGVGIPWVMLSHWPNLKSLILHPNSTQSPPRRTDFGTSRSPFYFGSSHYDCIDWTRPGATEALEYLEATGVTFNLEENGLRPMFFRSCGLFDGLKEYRTVVSRRANEHLCVLETIRKAVDTLEVLHLSGDGIFAYTSRYTTPTPISSPALAFASLRHLTILTLPQSPRMYLENASIELASVVPLLNDLVSSPVLESLVLGFLWHRRSYSPNDRGETGRVYEKEILDPKSPVWTTLDNTLSNTRRSYGTFKSLEISVHFTYALKKARAGLAVMWANGLQEALDGWTAEKVFPLICGINANSDISGGDESVKENPVKILLRSEVVEKDG